MPFLIDTALIAATSAYAHWLTEHKDMEPDFVWLEVVAGTVLCLAAAGARSRVRGGSWQDHERNVWRAFVIGGTPIIVGELSQWIRRRAERRRLEIRWR